MGCDNRSGSIEVRQTPLVQRAPLVAIEIEARVIDTCDAVVKIARVSAVRLECQVPRSKRPWLLVLAAAESARLSHIFGSDSSMVMDEAVEWAAGEGLVSMGINLLDRASTCTLIVGTHLGRDICNNLSMRFR